MFIAITTPQNPLRLENTLRPYKRGEKPFTPEVATQILQSTNHKKNIYDTLELIASLPKEEQAQYKDIILAAFDHREQPADTLLLGKKLAASHSFENELNAILNYDYTNDTTDGVIYASAPQKIAAYISAAPSIDLHRYPENINLICTNNKLNLIFIDLASFKSVKFKTGAEIKFSHCKNFSSVLDISTLRKADFEFSNLTGVSRLICGSCPEISLRGATGLPEEIDLTECSKASLHDCDLMPVKKLLCPKNGELNLGYAQNIPADTDFSVCSFVALNHGEFQTGEKIVFGKGSKVHLDSAKNLPKFIDVSQCDYINFKDADFNITEHIIFSSPQQMWKSDIAPEQNNKITFLNPPPAPTRIYER